MARLQGALSEMTKEDASYHMQRCIEAGLWVPDAKAAGKPRHCYDRVYTNAGHITL